MSNDPSITQALAIEEYKSSRERISKEVDFLNTLEITIVLAAGAIIAFSLTKDNKNIILFRISMSMIALMSTYGFIRYGSHRKVIRIHETYIIDFVEPILLGQIDQLTLGLASYYDQKKSQPIHEIGKQDNSGTLKQARYTIWIVLKILAVAGFLWSFVDPSLSGLM